MSYKRKPIPKNIREQVYEKCHGHCAYCGCKLEYKDMQVDHIVAVGRGGTNDLDNLLPSCRQCNYDKHEMSIERFRRRISKDLFKSLDRIFVYKLAKKYGMVEEHHKQVKFFFEQIEKEEINKNEV